MKRSDFQLIVVIGIILGVLFLVGGIYASRYFTRSGSPPAAGTYVFPYAAYSGILLGAGAVLLFLGIAAFLLAQRARACV